MILLNTCAVREKAEERVYQRASMLAEHKRRPNVVLGITGCMAEHLKGAIAERAPHVDLVVGPDGYRRLVDHVDRARGGAKIQDTELDRHETYEGLDPSREMTGEVTGHITIQRGCDKFCTFCVVPYTRGAEVSRPVEKIVAEAQRLADAGVREITLIGQNVNGYHGEDETGHASTLGKLLHRLSEIRGVARLRYTTSHPRDMGDDLIALHGDEPKLMPYLHLPFQAGSDRILNAMNRKHAAYDYAELVARIRQARPDIALSTDIIVGFPGETDADFEETLALVRRIACWTSSIFPTVHHREYGVEVPGDSWGLNS